MGLLPAGEGAHPGPPPGSSEEGSMRQDAELRVYVSSDGHGSVDYYMTGVAPDGQVQWLCDGCFRPGNGVSLSPLPQLAQLARYFRRAVAEVLSP